MKFILGHPNVGKSSLINGIMGKKVLAYLSLPPSPHSLSLSHRIFSSFQLVSTSRTPGHTKHFQTLFLTHSIRLCDCPGLVFPSLVERPLQVSSHFRT